MTDRESLPYRPCVGIVLTDGEGRVFAAERIDTPGAWQMPQGGIDEGESPEIAAFRELEEETGLGANSVNLEAEHPDWLTYELPEDLLGNVWKGRFRGQEQRWFLMRLTAPESAIRLATDHPEFSQWQWMDPAALISAIVPFKRQIYADVLGHFFEIG